MNKHFTKIFKGILFLALSLTLLNSCKRDNYNDFRYGSDPVEYGKYGNGFFLLHEGWLGHGTGLLTYYDFNTGKFTDSVYQKENPSKDFMPASSTLEYATIFNGKLFVIGKAGGPVVVANARTLKEIGRIPSAAGTSWYAFAGINSHKGLLSGSDGVYLFDIDNLSASFKLNSINSMAGDMLITRKYIFVQSVDEGVSVFDVNTYKLVKSYTNGSVAFAKTPNGKVWFTSGNYLLGVNQEDLTTDSVKLSFDTYNTWGGWHSGSIVGASQENSVYFIKSGMYEAGNQIYKYKDGDATSVANAFITAPDKQEFYGKGIGFDKSNNQLVTNTVQSGYGANFTVNNMYFYNPSTGELKKTIPYNKVYQKDASGNAVLVNGEKVDQSYFFTAMPVFYP